MGASADGRRQRHRRVDQHRPLAERRLELLQQFGLAGEGNGEYHNVAHLDCDSVLHAFDAAQRAGLLGDLRGRGLARSPSREPMTTDSPARAQRSASPEPSGPVPPTMAIMRCRQQRPAQPAYRATG